MFRPAPATCRGDVTGVLTGRAPEDWHRYSDVSSILGCWLLFRMSSTASGCRSTGAHAQWPDVEAVTFTQCTRPPSLRRHRLDGCTVTPSTP